MLTPNSLKLWLLCSLVLILAAAMPANAQALITIDNINLSCSTAAVTFTVDAAASDAAGSVTIAANSVQIGNRTADTTMGTRTVTVEYLAQFEGTLITFTVANSLSTVTTSVTCSGDAVSPPGLDPIDDGGTSEVEAVWDGYTDGRLNPDPAEYYTIYCQYDAVIVLIANPTTQMIARFPISTIQRLGIGASESLGDNMTIMRNSEDTLTIYGSNGNLAPASGEKAFSRSACLAANSGATTVTLPSVVSPPEIEVDEYTCTVIINSMYDLVRCSIGYILHLITEPSQTCPTINFTTASIVMLPLIRRRRKAKRKQP